MLFVKLLLEYNYIFIITTFLISSIVYYFSKVQTTQVFFKFSTSLKFIRVLLILSLLVSFFLHIFIFCLYIAYVSIYLKLPLIGGFAILPKYQVATLTVNLLNCLGVSGVSIYLTLDFFGLILLTLAYIVGFISILALDTRLH